MTTRSRGRGFKAVFDVVWGIATLAVIIIIALPHIKSTLNATPLSTILSTATDVPRTDKPFIPVQSQSLAQVEATSLAIYRATAQAANVISTPVVPNVDNTGDSAPLERQSKQNALQPAGDNVPTAEPVIEPQSSDMFGSKPAVVAPQTTHECKHAQVWTDSGCKNPTPTN